MLRATSGTFRTPEMMEASKSWLASTARRSSVFLDGAELGPDRRADRVAWVIESKSQDIARQSEAVTTNALNSGWADRSGRCPLLSYFYSHLGTLLE